MSTYIFGQYYSDKEVKEIMEGDVFKDSIVRNILELRIANEKFMSEVRKTLAYKLLCNSANWLNDKLK